MHHCCLPGGASSSGILLDTSPAAPVSPGLHAKQDVSVRANPLREPGTTQVCTNDNTNSQFFLSSKNPDKRADR
ncbi:MAG: hypothetical protein KBG16_06025 [Methanospirillum sp.]|nr:hypothetical protein [Methanospirillum sp.]